MANRLVLLGAVVTLLAACSVEVTDVHDATPVWTPSADPMQVVVFADGSGDAPTLAAALETAPDGAFIILADAEYPTEQITIDRDVEIHGFDTAVLVGPPGRTEPVLRIVGGKVMISSLGVQSNAAGDGADPAPLVEVVGGDVRMIDMRISDSGGVGMAVLGGRGSLDGNRFLDNVAAGLEVGATVGSEWTIEHNWFEQNWVGLMVLGAPTVRDNAARRNVGSGFQWLGRAGGLASDNYAEANGGVGFEVGPEAAPALSGSADIDNGG